MDIVETTQKVKQYKVISDNGTPKLEQILPETTADQVIVSKTGIQTITLENKLGATEIVLGVLNAATEKINTDFTAHQTDSTAHSDIREKITAIENKIPAAATDTNKLVDQATFDSGIQTVTEIANGKTNTYVIPIVDSYKNDIFNSQDNDVGVSKYPPSGTVLFVSIDQKPIYAGDLKLGDTFLVDDTGVPDRWVSYITTESTGLLNITFSQLETRKVTVYTKTSELTNDGDGSSAFATQSYVDTNGGKIDTIKVNGTAQAITDKSVNITIPTKLSEFTNDKGYLTAHQDISKKADKVSMTAGTYSVVNVNNQGVVTQGGNLIEFGTEPSSNLAVGGLFFME
jgi:hypothetical protein